MTIAERDNSPLADYYEVFVLDDRGWLRQCHDPHDLFFGWDARYVPVEDGGRPPTGSIVIRGSEQDARAAAEELSLMERWVCRETLTWQAPVYGYAKLLPFFSVTPDGMVSFQLSTQDWARCLVYLLFDPADLEWEFRPEDECHCPEDFSFPAVPQAVIDHANEVRTED